MITRTLIGLLLSLCLASPSWAAVAGAAAGTAAAGTTTLSLPLPASLADGDLLVICIGTKYPNSDGTTKVSTPSGYTAPSNYVAVGDDNLDTDANPSTGTGTNDQGAVNGTLFYKVAASESGNVAVTITSGNSAAGVIGRYTNSGAGFAWVTPVAAQGNDSVPGTTYSAAMGTLPDILGGDFIVACTGKNANALNSAEAMATTGVTYGAATERTDAGTSFGDNVSLVLSDHAVTSVTTPSGVPTFSMTAVGATTVGGTVILRIREQATTPITPQSSQGFLGAIIK